MIPDDPTATYAVQGAVNFILNDGTETSVADALARIICVAAHDLNGFAEEMDPWT